jgi:hypothetical protein
MSGIRKEGTNISKLQLTLMTASISFLMNKIKRRQMGIKIKKKKETKNYKFSRP